MQHACDLQQLTGIQEDFVANISALCTKLFEIAVTLEQQYPGRYATKDLTLSQTCKALEVMLLNLYSRPAVVCGYITQIYYHEKELKLVLDNKEAIKDEHIEFFWNHPTLFTSLPADKVLLFKKLFKEDLTAEEKKDICAFFETYNIIVEDWMHFGGEHTLRPHDAANPRKDVDKAAYDIIISIKKKGLPVRT